MERPLIGEPLAVDLVNTRWRTPDGDVDLLDTPAGFAQWLDESGLAVRAHAGVGMDAGVRDARSTDARSARAALVHTRDVLRRAFAHEPGADDEVNAILARALIVRSLVDGQVHEQPFFPDDSWRAAWLAADDYARLRATGADSIRQCDGQPCVLYFYDPSGRRRWCSMARCGNRAKAHRHYTKQAHTKQTQMEQAPGQSSAATDD